MTNQGPWLANNILAFKPDLDYAAVPFPVAADIYHPDKPIGLLDADVLVIPRGVRHPEFSFRFIEYCQRQDVMERLARAHCKNSPLAASSTAFIENHPHRSIRAHDAIANSPRAVIFPRTRTWPQYEADFNAGMQRMWTLAASPADALAGIERRAQAAIDQAARQRERRAALKERSA
jgi:maltose-binding protein MalE